MQLPRCQRYQSLDLWRGIACLSIIFVHSTYYVATKENDEHCIESIANTVIALTARLWIGVPLFFVISGYCIAAAADSTRIHGTSTATYFWRRFRRIYPPYWVLFGMAVIIVGATEYAIWPGLFSDDNHGFVPPWKMTPQTFFGYVTLTVTWIGHFLAGVEPYSFLGHVWTLCYEEQFYAIVGVGLLIARKHFFLFMAAVSVAVIFLNVTPFVSRDHFVGFFFDGRWLHFALGVIVYYDGNYASRFASFLLRITVVGMMVYAMLLLGGLRTLLTDVIKNGNWISYGPRILDGLLSFHSNDGQQLLAAAFFAATLIVLRPFDESISRSRITRPVAWCGTMCYSLYLVHWPLVKAISHGLFLQGMTSKEQTLMITVPICVAVSLAAGWAFHLGVERRFLNSKSTDKPLLN